jgi:hypothetical protein
MHGTHGVKVKITVGTVLTAVTNLLSATFPEQLKYLAEMAAHPTTGATGYTEFVDTGLREMGEFEVELGWDTSQTTHAAMLTAFAATAPVNMSIEDPTGDEVIAFSAHIRSVGRLAANKDGYKARVRIRPTGAPTIT